MSVEWIEKMRGGIGRLGCCYTVVMPGMDFALLRCVSFTPDGGVIVGDRPLETGQKNVRSGFEWPFCPQNAQW